MHEDIRQVIFVFFTQEDILHCVSSVRIQSFSDPYSVQRRDKTVSKTPNTDIFDGVLVFAIALQLY